MHLHQKQELHHEPSSGQGPFEAIFMPPSSHVKTRWWGKQKTPLEGLKYLIERSVINYDMEIKFKKENGNFSSP